MARFLSRTITGGVACLTNALALLLHPTAHAETQTWQSVQQAGVLRCGQAVAAPSLIHLPGSDESRMALMSRRADALADANAQ